MRQIRQPSVPLIIIIIIIINNNINNNNRLALWMRQIQQLSVPLIIIIITTFIIIVIIIINRRLVHAPDPAAVGAARLVDEVALGVVGPQPAPHVHQVLRDIIINGQIIIINGQTGFGGPWTAARPTCPPGPARYHRDIIIINL